MFEKAYRCRWSLLSKHEAYFTLGKKLKPPQGNLSTERLRKDFCSSCHRPFAPLLLPGETGRCPPTHAPAAVCLSVPPGAVVCEPGVRPLSSPCMASGLPSTAPGLQPRVTPLRKATHQHRSSRKTSRKTGKSTEHMHKHLTGVSSKADYATEMAFPSLWFCLGPGTRPASFSQWKQSLWGALVPQDRGEAWRAVLQDKQPLTLNSTLVKTTLTRKRPLEFPQVTGRRRGGFQGQGARSQMAHIFACGPDPCQARPSHQTSPSLYELSPRAPGGCLTLRTRGRERGQACYTSFGNRLRLVLSTNHAACTMQTVQVVTRSQGVYFNGPSNISQVSRSHVIVPLRKVTFKR